VSLSVRDPVNLDDYIGDDEDWDQAESMLADVSDDLSLDAERIEGEAAIYGPKLDYMFEDSLGREWQLATIQIDFAMPKRFELTYTTEENEKATPVMIHRAILGSYERFMAVLIEHFGGDFPLWLAPEQVRVLPISDDQKEYANEVHEQLKDSGLRAAIDASDETLGKKIRNLNQKKVPYFIVIGDDEVESGTVTLEDRTDGTVGMMNVDEVCEALQKEITNQQV
jgi:threonyl-tRNA synthetase